MTVSVNFLLAMVILVLGHGLSAAGETWDMPVPYGDGIFHTVNARAFAADVELGTDGELTITVHSGGSLVRHPQIRNSVRDGLVPIGEVLMSRSGNEDAVFGLDSVPFLATGYGQAERLHKASLPVIEARLAKQGLLLLYAVPWPPQGIYAGREIRTAGDLAGMKFRVYNPATERMAALAGALPAQVEAPDIPAAFASGRVEAMITSPTMGVNTRAWDYVSHYHHTRAALPKNMVIVNRDAFMALAPGIRVAVMEAARRAEARGWAASRKEADGKIAILEEHGMMVVMPDEELMDSFRTIGDAMTEEWAVRAGDAGLGILEAYRRQ